MNGDKNYILGDWYTTMKKHIGDIIGENINNLILIKSGTDWIQHILNKLNKTHPIPTNVYE